MQQQSPAEPGQANFKNLTFENTAFNYFPIEVSPRYRIPHKVSGFIYSKTLPTPLKNPSLISVSQPAAQLLDLDAKEIQEDKDAIDVLIGNKVANTSIPIAQCYCGYQFGSFAGQLGDGRAITLGDIRSKDGNLWELQLKGAGKTPYSRFADGRAVLRSSVREFLASELMFALGVPTTRALSLINSDDTVKRDPLYNGNAIDEKCAVVCRMAPTFMRFGSFEICLPPSSVTREGGPSHQYANEFIPKMLDYLLTYHYEDIANKTTDKQVQYRELFQEVVKRTAFTVAMWQCFGFCHGVLNTDNMSILGLTIDYGPFGFMEHFDKNLICNHSDEGGRYSYQNQPKIGKWNLNKLAEALNEAIPMAESKKFVEENYYKYFNEAYYGKMRHKLGLLKVEKKEDEKLIDDLIDLMDECGTDFTNGFRILSKFEIEKQNQQQVSSNDDNVISEILDMCAPEEIFIQKNRPQFNESQLLNFKNLQLANPMILEMMGFSEETLKSEEEKLKKWNQFRSEHFEDRLSRFRNQWSQWVSQYKNRLSEEISNVTNEEKIQEIQQARVQKMNTSNPKYILRNYLAQQAIEKADKGDYSEVNNLLEVLLNPFDLPKKNSKELTNKNTYCQLQPKWAYGLCVSCSS